MASRARVQAISWTCRRASAAKLISCISVWKQLLYAANGRQSRLAHKLEMSKLSFAGVHFRKWATETHRLQMKYKWRRAEQSFSARIADLESEVRQMTEDKSLALSAALTDAHEELASVQLRHETALAEGHAEWETAARAALEAADGLDRARLAAASARQLQRRNT